MHYGACGSLAVRMEVVYLCRRRSGSHISQHSITHPARYACHDHSPDRPRHFSTARSPPPTCCGPYPAVPMEKPQVLTNECLKDALGVLLVPLTNLFNFCFSQGCCPPQWCHSYLLTLYKGKGSKSDPNSARGIALQSRLLNIIGEERLIRAP